MKKVILMSLVGWIASGCGASQSVNSPAYNSTVALGSSSSSTICNEVTTTNVNAKIRTVDGNPNMVRVRIVSLNSIFDGNPNFNLQFFRSKAVAQAESLDATPLTFHIETASTNGASGNELTPNMTGINISNISQIANSNNLNTSGSAQFFSIVDLIIHDVSVDYQVLKIAIVNGNSNFASVEALLPPFIVNPISYDANHASFLGQLHPFANQAGYSDSQYLSMSQNFCF